MMRLAVVIASAVFLFVRGVEAQTGPYGSLGVVIDQGYEANIFATPISLGPGERDLVTRVGPVLEAGYRSDPFRIAGRYEIAAERFWDHRELDRRVGRQDAAMDFGVRAGRHLEFGGVASFIDTYSPLQLSTPEAIVLGRVHAERLAVQPTMTYEWTAGSQLRLDYEGAREALADSPGTLVHTVGARMARTTDLRTTYTFGYRVRRFGPPGGETETSHVLAGGWIRNIARLAEIELTAGPRLFDGSIRPDVEAAIRRRLRRTELAVEFAETETSVLGERGIVEVRRIRVAAIVEATRNFRFTAAPMVVRNARDERHATVMGLDLEALAQLSRGVSLGVVGQIGRHDGNLGGTFERIPYYSVGTTLRIVYPGNPRNVPDEGRRR